MYARAKRGCWRDAPIARPIGNASTQRGGAIAVVQGNGRARLGARALHGRRGVVRDVVGIARTAIAGGREIRRGQRGGAGEINIDREIRARIADVARLVGNRRGNRYVIRRTVGSTSNGFEYRLRHKNRRVTAANIAGQQYISNDLAAKAKRDRVACNGARWQSDINDGAVCRFRIAYASTGFRNGRDDRRECFGCIDHHAKRRTRGAGVVGDIGDRRDDYGYRAIAGVANNGRRDRYGGATHQYVRCRQGVGDGLTTPIQIDRVARFGARAGQAEQHIRAVCCFGSIDATAGIFRNTRNCRRKRRGDIDLDRERCAGRADISHAVCQRCREVERTAATGGNGRRRHRYRRAVVGDIRRGQRIAHRLAAPI